MTDDREPVGADELAALFERSGCRPAARTALAVSGGIDSTALMVLFADWLRHRGGNASLHTVLTVDHGLRPESAAEARAVACRAASLGFRHATLVWEGAKPQAGVQSAARSARYRRMADYMMANDTRLLLTGHTRDDQAETILMRLARGSGLDGLAGIAPRLHFSGLGLDDLPANDLAIARPLLDMPRSRLRATLDARGMTWIDDPSNQSLEFERPRLRAARAQLDDLGLTDAKLALSASRLLRARRAIDRTVREFLRPDAGAVAVDPCGFVTIDRMRWRDAEEEIALRVLGRAIAAVGGSEEPVSMAKLEAIVAPLRGTGMESAKSTLARTVITADDRTITVEREPGREPLPRLTLAAGTVARWDGRFRVSSNVGAGTVEVRPLGEAAARELRQQGAVSTDTPVRVIGLAPSFWRQDRFVALPSLDVWPDPDCRGLFKAHFIWDEMARVGRG